MNDTMMVAGRNSTRHPDRLAQSRVWDRAGLLRDYLAPGGTGGTGGTGGPAPAVLPM
jgi:hypothetical protein